MVAASKAPAPTQPPSLKRKKSSADLGANFAQASTADSHKTLMLQVWNWMEEEHSHILPAWDLVNKRRKALAEAGDPVLVATEQIDASCIAKWPQEFKIRVLTENSDFAQKHVFELFKADPHVLDDLLHNALQIPAMFKLPAELRYVPVLLLWIDMRLAQVGQRSISWGVKRLNGGAEAAVKKVYHMVICVYV